MTVLDQPPPKSVEEYMTREKELGVWSYPHFVRYLRALIYKLTPAPHGCTQMVLDAVDEILTERCAPRLLKHLITNAPRKPGRGRAAREAANAICEVVSYWAGFQGATVMRARDEHNSYHRALALAKSAECEALDVGITANELYECAVVANTDATLDENRRDAALAAISAGHFKLAHEIATDAPDDKAG
jgi:hypothetical protein